MELPNKRGGGGEKIGIRIRILREEHEQCIILSIIGLLRRTRNKPFIYLIRDP